MLKNIGEGLLILDANGYKQVSVSDTRILAGGKNLAIESADNLNSLGWYYDSNLDSWIFETVGENEE